MSHGLSYNGRFKEAGLVGRLETKDFGSADFTSRFVGAIADCLCVEENAGSVTNIFLENVDITMPFHLRKGSVGCSDDNLETLSTSSTTNKRVGVEVFQEF